VRFVWAIVHVLGNVNAVGLCEIGGLSILCLGCSGGWKWRGDDEERLLMGQVLKAEERTSRDCVSSEEFGIRIRKVDTNRNIRNCARRCRATATNNDVHAKLSRCPLYAEQRFCERSFFSGSNIWSSNITDASEPVIPISRSLDTC